MKCPNCDIEMKLKIEDSGPSMAFWDRDEDEWDGSYIIETHKCKQCKIKYVLDQEPGCGREEWTIPVELEPSDKQIKTIFMIDNIFNSSNIEDIHTKKQAWKFINENLDDAIKQKEVNEEQNWYIRDIVV